MNTCSGITKTGRQCANPVYGYNIKCRTHASADDIALVEEKKAIYEAGRRSGYESRVNEERWQRASEERERERAAAEAANFRLHDAFGQLVTVDKGLCYRWTGSDPLQVGDTVIVPGNWLFPNQQRMTVVSLGSSFTGTIVDIVRRVESAVNA